VTNLNPTRRRFRFSLRTLLALVVLLGVGLGWVVQQAERQRKAVEAIRKAGGIVRYDYEMDEGGNAEPPVPTWLMRLVGDDYFADVAAVGYVRREGIDDVLLEHIKGLTELEFLLLHETDITDEDLNELREALPNCDIAF